MAAGQTVPVRRVLRQPTKLTLVVVPPPASAVTPPQPAALASSHKLKEEVEVVEVEVAVV